MISLLIGLLILAIIIYVVNLILAQLALPPVVKTIAYLIVGIIGLIWLLSALGINTGLGSAPLLR